MSDEHKVIKKFRKDISEHLDVIRDETKKGNIDEAKIWLNELTSMKRGWEQEFSKPGYTLETGLFATGFRKLNTTSVRELAGIRIEILDKAITIATKMINQKLIKISRKAA